MTQTISRAAVDALLFQRLTAYSPAQAAEITDFTSPGYAIATVLGADADAFAMLASVEPYEALEIGFTLAVSLTLSVIASPFGNDEATVATAFEEAREAIHNAALRHRADVATVRGALNADALAQIRKDLGPPGTGPLTVGLAILGSGDTQQSR